MTYAKVVCGSRVLTRWRKLARDALVLAEILSTKNLYFGNLVVVPEIDLVGAEIPISSSGIMVVGLPAYYLLFSVPSLCQ
jgi:hypothetical protein